PAHFAWDGMIEIKDDFDTPRGVDVDIIDLDPRPANKLLVSIRRPICPVSPCQRRMASESSRPIVRPRMSEPHRRSIWTSVKRKVRIAEARETLRPALWRVSLSSNSRPCALVAIHPPTGARALRLRNGPWSRARHRAERCNAQNCNLRCP